MKKVKTVTVSLDKTTADMLEYLCTHDCFGNIIPVSDRDRSCSMSSVINDAIVNMWIKVHNEKVNNS